MSDVLTTVQEWVKQALELRYSRTLPAVEEGLQGSLHALLDCRQALDRVEELLSKAQRLRAELSRQENAARTLYDDAWDQRSRETAKTAREYVSAKERHADISLDVMALAISARQKATLLSHVDEAESVIRLTHRGLDGLRMDIHRMMGAYSHQSYVEQTTIQRGS